MNMISYEIKINGSIIKRVDAWRVHSRNVKMEIEGYLYKFEVYDYENKSFLEGEVVHKYKDGAGKLLELIWKKLP